MSLDFYIVCEHCESHLFSANITHNLGEMAEHARIYECLWHPDEHGYNYAKDIIQPLTDGYERLINEQDFFKSFNPPNAWGNYDGFVKFVKEVLDACKEYPNYKIITCT